MNKTAHKLYLGFFFFTGIFVTFFLAYNGFNYYSTTIEERFFLDQHITLKPSGGWGHGFGILGSLMMMIGVAVYMVRKRYRKLFNLGYLKHWLEFHIFLCSVGPILVLYHTSFKFGGIVVVSFWSMVVVVLSGVIGRFIYVQIPRSISGQELSIKELDQVTEDINNKLKSIDKDSMQRISIASDTDKYRNIGFSKSLSLTIDDFFERKRVLRQLKHNLNNSGITEIKQTEIITAANQKLIITRRIGLLRTTQKAFRYWHVAHLPFAIVMFVIMLIHVVVTIVMGSKWIF